MPSERFAVTWKSLLEREAVHEFDGTGGSPT
jgi:hypothetical protein